MDIGKFIISIVVTVFKILSSVILGAFKINTNDANPWYKFSEYEWGYGWIILYYLLICFTFKISFILYYFIKKIS